MFYAVQFPHLQHAFHLHECTAMQRGYADYGLFHVKVRLQGVPVP